ncbi:MAG: DUF6194 family protein [Tepidisphaeraceae bacterium]
MSLTAANIVHALRNDLGPVDVVEAHGDFYFFRDPQDGKPVDHMFPFTTLVTDDKHDAFSNLNRPGVYRLNVGVSRETYLSLFGEQKLTPDENSVAARGYDFAALDTILPHPVYGRMWWICVLSPSEGTFARVRPLLAEAYTKAAARSAK